MGLPSCTTRACPIKVLQGYILYLVVLINTKRNSAKCQHNIEIMLHGMCSIKTKTFS